MKTHIKIITKVFTKMKIEHIVIYVCYICTGVIRYKYLIVGE